jgi:biopolymer transport protein ExbB
MTRSCGVISLLLLGLPSLATAVEGPGIAETWGLTQSFHWFARGGPIVYPILACSIIGLAVFLERLAFLLRKHLLPERFARGVTRAWQRGEFEEAWRFCQQRNIPLARILRAGLRKLKDAPQEMERAIEVTGSHEAGVLETNLRFLGAISNIAPMLGFLGTVTGLITAFNVISIQGTGDPKLMADGVSEALITTEFGLFVGIPALGAYHHLRGKVDRLLHEMEAITIELLSAPAFMGGKAARGTPMRFLKKSEDDFSINLPSMTDIIFILLIFFMVAMVLKDSTRRLDVQLPEARSGQAPGAPRLTIEMAADGVMLLNGELVTQEQLEQQLQHTASIEYKRLLLINYDK